jgi:hypothetical protein
LTVAVAAGGINAMAEILGVIDREVQDLKLAIGIPASS